MDTISFIALKCTEERNIQYVFKVDASAGAHGLGWLRLVQSTSSPEEKNLETRMKTGEMYFKSICPVHRGEQLLVWYDGQISSMAVQDLRASTYGKDGAPSICLKRGINFHNLAQDMEREKREEVFEESAKSVLLEKTNCLARRDEGMKMGMLPIYRGGGHRLLKAEVVSKEQSAFTQVHQLRGLHSADQLRRGTAGSAFSPVPSTYRHKTSAFSKPFKGGRAVAPVCCDMSLDVSSLSVTHCQASFITPAEYASITNTRTAPNDLWPKPTIIPQAPQVLPPTFPPLAATAQNWCAKCKLSFRMTSDLVLHMRSLHKREAGGGTCHRKRREPQLSCPVCCASFRERHHLSRHMTSHC